LTLKDVPDDYDFVIRSQSENFAKGSQVFLCYGRLSNRDALKRYGFSLTMNKYNYINIKLRLEPNEPDFKYRKYIIQKFFSVDKSEHEDLVEEKSSSRQMDIQSRHFRIYYQRLNTKVLKFIKILTFNPREDDIACIVETRSLSLEYLSLKRLKSVYQ
jgi:hypothetical protein